MNSPIASQQQHTVGTFPARAPEGPWSAAGSNVDPGAIYREALRQTDLIMETVRNWFGELPTPLDDRGYNADGGILQTKSSLSREGTMMKIVWGANARCMLADVELQVVERMAAWLTQDRGAPVDVAGALAQRRIEETLPKRIHKLLAQEAILEPLAQEAIPDFLRNLGSIARDLERFRPETPENGGSKDPNQFTEWGRKVTEAEAKVNAQTNNPNDWIVFVLAAINRGFRNADIFLAAMDQGVRQGVAHDGLERGSADTDKMAAGTEKDQERAGATEAPNTPQLGQESKMEQARSAGVLPVAVPARAASAPDYSRGPEIPMSMRMRNGGG